MKDSLRQALSLVTLIGMLMSLAACQSTPKQGTSTKDAATLAQIADKQQQQDQLLKEWQNLKPGLERLLVIEEELNLLLGQLAQLTANLDNPQAAPSVAQASRAPVPTQMIPVVSSTPPVTDTPPAQVVAPVTPVAVSQPAIAPANLPASARSGGFALQVASITELHRLPEIWQQLQNKHPRLMATMEPNYQKTQVRNTDYYRLKIGQFASRQEANSKCSALQSAGVNCLVVDYTESRFADLANQ